MLGESQPVSHFDTERVLLVGLESSGKTTLFSRLTDYHVGSEINVKGSTYRVQAQKSGNCIFIDTPGLKTGDSLSRQVVKKELERAHRLILVIRGTQFHDELSLILPLITDHKKPFVILVSHADKMTRESRQFFHAFMLKNKLPLILTDTRKLSEKRLDLIRSFLSEQPALTRQQIDLLMTVYPEDVIPEEHIFTQNFWGYMAAFFCILSIFFVPVIVAYHLSEIVQPFADWGIVQPLNKYLSQQPALFRALIIGKYGLLSLGLYSFIWAFPVVVLIGLSTAVVDESGLKDRMVDCLDPLLQKIGLNGQDLVPVLTGFGCNVVAVFQTRNCSFCTRAACVSFIGFGASCSYQIGATLSLFSAAHHVWLFLPYIVALLLGGILHTRLWHHQAAATLGPSPFIRRSFLQMPTAAGIWFRLKSVIKQFLFQAMPIFIVICIVAAFLDLFNLIHYFSYLFYPLLSLMHLPTDAGTGLAFSMIRKDGMLVFNQDGGALLAHLSVSQLFLLVYIASTMSACFVTIWTVGREFGSKKAASFVIRQWITSTICSLILFVLLLPGSDLV